MIAIVETLYNILYYIFSKELLNLNIGYEFNRDSLRSIMDIVNAIDYIRHNNATNSEIIKIIQYYDEKYQR